MWMLSLNAPPLLIFLYYKCIKWQTIITQLWSSSQFYGAFGVFQLFGLVVQPATFKILFIVLFSSTYIQRHRQLFHNFHNALDL